MKALKVTKKKKKIGRNFEYTLNGAGQVQLSSTL